MEINGWGMAIIALLIVAKYGSKWAFRIMLLRQFGGSLKKVQAMIPGGKSHDDANRVDV